MKVTGGNFECRVGYLVRPISATGAVLLPLVNVDGVTVHEEIFSILSSGLGLLRLKL